MTERWRPIKGYEGLYMVSNEGRVYSFKQDKMINQYINNHGYYFVALSSKKWDWKYYYVHRLVAEAFVHNPKPEEFDVVNHKDENKLNPRWDNLEWMTRGENVRLANSRKVICLETNKTYDSIAIAAKENGLKAGTISSALNGRRKSAGKHPITGDDLHWEYVNKKETA